MMIGFHMRRRAREPLSPDEQHQFDELGARVVRTGPSPYAHLAEEEIKQHLAELDKRYEVRPVDAAST